MKTKIEWTDATWNPVTGCTKVSPGCKNCYAEKMAIRLWGKRKFTDIRLEPERLKYPLHWRKPRLVFVNSMSDLFHEKVPFDFVNRVFETICTAKHHTYQILTKRAPRMREYFAGMNENAFIPENVLIGVSCENRLESEARIPHLRAIDRARRFVSFEPLLEDVGEINLEGIHWVIIGGESGPKARPFNIDWARNIIRQCKEQNVKVFMKQVGSHPVGWDMDESNFVRAKLKSRKGSDPSEWPVDLRIREYPQSSMKEAT